MMKKKSVLKQTEPQGIFFLLIFPSGCENEQQTNSSIDILR